MPARESHFHTITPDSVSPEHRAKLLTGLGAAGFTFWVLSAFSAARAAQAAQTLDRVVAAVGRVAITASDVEQEYRLEYFLEQGKAPPAPPDRATLERVRDQLINQELLAREAASEGAGASDTAPGDPAELATVRKKYASSEDFLAALRSLGMDEREFAARLAARERSLKLIDQHLRPLASVESQDIETYYRQTFLADFARRGEGAAPALAGVEQPIREILVQKKINEMLPGWLESLRASLRVEVYPWP